MCGAQGWASQKADSRCPSNTVHTYFKKSSVVFLSSLMILPCLVLSLAFSPSGRISRLCSYYYSSVNWTKGLHGLCWFDIDFETYKLSPGIGALLNTCSYSLVNCMRALHFALCTSVDLVLSLLLTSWVLVLGTVLNLAYHTHIFFQQEHWYAYLDGQTLGSYQVLDFFLYFSEQNEILTAIHGK